MLDTSLLLLYDILYSCRALMRLSCEVPDAETHSSEVALCGRVRLIVCQSMMFAPAEGVAVGDCWKSR
jgi:hypothetical protein